MSSTSAAARSRSRRPRVVQQTPQPTPTLRIADVRDGEPGTYTQQTSLPHWTPRTSTVRAIYHGKTLEIEVNSHMHVIDVLRLINAREEEVRERRVHRIPVRAMIVHRDFRSMPRLAWERIVTESTEYSMSNWTTMDVDALLQTRLEDLHGPQFDFKNGETWIVDTMKRDYWRDQ